MGLELTTDRYPPIMSQTRYPLCQSVYVQYKTAIRYMVKESMIFDKSNMTLHKFNKQLQGDPNILFEMPEILLFDIFEQRWGEYGWSYRSYNFKVGDCALKR